MKSKQSYTQPHIAKSVPSCFNKSIIQVIICIKLINRHCENINPTGFLTIIMDFHLEFHMPHSSVIIRRKLFIKFYSFWSQGKKRKKRKGYRCSRVNSSWSSGHVSAAGMCSLLTAEQGNAAKTTRLLQRAKSGCGRSCVSPQRGFMVGSGF